MFVTWPVAAVLTLANALLVLNQLGVTQKLFHGLRSRLVITDSAGISQACAGAGGIPEDSAVANWNP